MVDASTSGAGAEVLGLTSVFDSTEDRLAVSVSPRIRSTSGAASDIAVPSVPSGLDLGVKGGFQPESFNLRHS